MGSNCVAWAFASCSVMCCKAAYRMLAAQEPAIAESGNKFAFDLEELGMIQATHITGSIWLI